MPKEPQSDEPELLAAVDATSPAFDNPAVARCARAFQDAYSEVLRKSGFESDAMKKAAEAYRTFLPPLTSRDNCRDFIACVAHGMLLGVIGENNGGKLLYAAQVAIVAAGAEDRAQKAAGYAAYANLTASEARSVQKFMPRRSCES